jgi:hypothetical protein
MGDFSWIDDAINALRFGYYESDELSAETGGLTTKLERLKKLQGWKAEQFDCIFLFQLELASDYCV